MIILIHGPDAYRARQKLAEIVEHYKKNHKSLLNLRYFDSERDNLPELLDWLKQTSMFKGKKLVVLRNSWKLSSQFKRFTELDRILLFFEERAVRGRVPELFKTQKFDFLSGPALRAWVKKEFARFGARSVPGAADKLIEFVGSNSWVLANEIKKLAAWSKSKEVRIEDVELLVRPRIETDIFQTIDAIASKDKKLALTFLKRHLQKGENPLYLLSMIHYQFRNLILAKSGGLRKLKVHPFVLRKSTIQASKFSREELKKIYRKIFEADVSIKTGKMEAETALDLLISEI